MNTILVIMAAGIGSRFGGGIKQLQAVGPNGEIIMDYSIHDAIEAGFDKIVFIIRRDIEKDFKEIIGDRISKRVSVAYAFQELDDLPEGFSKGNRTKPWGTGQAVLACKGIVNEPFAVINADDYYGKESFEKIHEFLTNENRAIDGYEFAMAGFKLKNTLSDNGGVTRGVCEVDAEGYLQKVTETSNIEHINGMPAVRSENEIKYLNGDSCVSMNFWGLTSAFIDCLENGFMAFLSCLGEDDVKSEYLLPTIIDEMIKSKKAKVKVLDVDDKWFGVTYQQDKYSVQGEFKKLHDHGVYSNLK